MNNWQEQNEDALEQAMKHEEAALALNSEGVGKRWL